MVLTDNGERILSLAEGMEHSALAIERRLTGDSDQPKRSSENFPRRLVRLLRPLASSYRTGATLPPDRP